MDELTLVMCVKCGTVRVDGVVDPESIQNGLCRACLRPEKLRLEAAPTVDTLWDPKSGAYAGRQRVVFRAADDQVPF